MVNFTIDQIRVMMDRKENIRNMSVIAHVDHGKSTLSDSLIAKAGIIAEKDAGDRRIMDTREDEQARGITIKSTSVSLYYEREQIVDDEKEVRIEKIPYLINLIDSPGHVDFSSEVTAALRVTDGALVVVDCIEGVCVQTETVLRQAISERIRPILWLNKLDRVFLELQPTLEECYKNFRNSIESVNVICQTYKDEKLGNIDLLPENGRVGFGSGLMAWGFTLKHFAQMYCSKFGLSEDKMMKKLWGENYWDPKEKKWLKKNPGGLERGFNQFVLFPIRTIFDAVNNEKTDVYEPIVKALRLKIPKGELDKAKIKTKDVIKLVMRHWIPAGDALLDMFVEHLPSPTVAQKYRVENLYSGPLDSPEAEAVRKCDPDGILAMYISKMVPTSEKGRFIAFGRVFAGTVKTGQEVRILGPDYEHGKKTDLAVKKIQRTLLMMGKYVEQIIDCPAGNVCGLVGIDQFLLKSGTLTTSEEFYPFVTMKFSVAAVVQVAVEPKNAADLPKLVEGLKRLSKSDPLVKCMTSKTGQHIIAGAGELHLEICLKDLRDDFMKGAEIIVSEPIVSFAETVSMKTGEDGQYPTPCVAKSPNKHNRLYINAAPLDEKFILALEKGELKLSQDMKAFGRQLAEEFNWDVGEARKIWTFGCPPDGVANVVVDTTKGIQFLNEIKDHVVGAFMQVTTGGVLCDEVMRGIRFNVEDVKLHADAIHRGAGQIMPCAKSVFYACQIASGPKLLEPLYLVDIMVPQQAVAGVFATLNQKRGQVEKIEERPGTPLTQVQAFLPVLESFGFTELLRKNTAGQAFPQMKFSHWQHVNGDPMKEGTQAHQILMNIRKRKGLKDELPNFNDYYDKIN